jgi:hypothetical protein
VSSTIKTIGETSAQNENQQSRSQKIQSHGQRKGQKEQRLQEPPTFEQRKKTKETSAAGDLGRGCRNKEYSQVDTVSLTICFQL